MSFASEEDFLALVKQDVWEFLQCDPDNHDRVLVFRAFNKRLRYLIHQLVSDDFEGLTTKSFGKEGERFTCVCFSDRGGSDENCDQFAPSTMKEAHRKFSLSSSGLGEPSSNHSRGVSPASSTRSSLAGEGGSSRRRTKRPDKEVYIPKARLAHHHVNKLSNRNKGDLSVDLEALSLRDSDDAATPATSRCCSRTTTPTSEVLNAAKIALGEKRYLNGDIYCGDDYLSSSGSNTPNGGSSSKDSSCKNSPRLSEDEEQLEEGEVNDDDDGEKRRPCDGETDLVELLREAFGGGALEICRAKEDYSAFKTAGLNPSEYPHVLELYEFPKAFRERDLFRAFGKYRDGGGFEVKWVDDTSALGVFSSVAAAEEALHEGSSICRMRPLSEGSVEALVKAQRIRYALVPAMKRPETNFSFARRMIGHALGQRLNVSKEKTEAERQQLDDAKGEDPEKTDDVVVLEQKTAATKKKRTRTPLPPPLKIHKTPENADDEEEEDRGRCNGSRRAAVVN